jgi:hypothetical protein
MPIVSSADSVGREAARVAAGCPPAVWLWAAPRVHDLWGVLASGLYPDRRELGPQRQAAFQRAYARWADPTNQQEFGELARQSLQELQAVSASLS